MGLTVNSLVLTSPKKKRTDLTRQDTVNYGADESQLSVVCSEDQ